MKKNIFCLVLVSGLSIYRLFGQVGVGTNTPHASAMLDVQSALKGMKIPTLTTTQMQNMPAPLADGLLIYNSSYHQVMQYAGGVWRSLLNSDFWAKPSSTHSYITTTDSVSIGNTLATAPLDVDGKIKASEDILSGTTMIGTANLVNTGGAIFQDDISTNGDLNLKNAGSLLSFRHNAGDRAFVQLSGNNLRSGLYSDNVNGKVYFHTGGVDRMVLHNNGNVTIGSTSDVGISLFVNGKLNVIGDVTSTTTIGDIETSNINDASKGTGNNLECLCYGHFDPNPSTSSYVAGTNNTSFSGGMVFNCPGITVNSTIIVTIDRKDFEHLDQFTINARYRNPGQFSVKMFSTEVFPWAAQISREEVGDIVGFSYIVYK